MFKKKYLFFIGKEVLLLFTSPKDFIFELEEMDNG